MTVKIKFLGAAGCVTGSKYLVTCNEHKFLVDIGMFQGSRELNERNWKNPDFDLRDIEGTLITHAHIDHIGMIPRYVRLGLNCPIYCTKATYDLARLLLLDAGHIQEEEAEYRKKKGASRYNPPLPLFTSQDAITALTMFKPVDFNSEIKISDQVSAIWSPMGHILGAAAITMKVADKIINFSGDIGRYNVPILFDPKPLDLGDLLLVESTYGDRLHAEEDPKGKLTNIINRVYKRRGVIVIPSFAVGRAQLLLYCLRELKEEGKIPDLPIVVDSPMATDATTIYRQHPECYDQELSKELERGLKPFVCSKLAFVKDRNESIKLNSIHEPMIIISASGMLTGGRILHHVKNRISDKRNCIVFVGFQPPGTKGDLLKRGAKSIRILGDELMVNAEIESVPGLSAHGDQSEMLKWCQSCTNKPKRFAVVHGEPGPAETFSKLLTEKLGWNGFVAKSFQEIEI